MHKLNELELSRGSRSFAKFHFQGAFSLPSPLSFLKLPIDYRHNVSWRDVQHIIARTSRSDILCSEDWKTNGAGLTGKASLLPIAG